eukprot:2466930-Alexandrium_andersonii.AAC.1
MPHPLPKGQKPWKPGSRLSKKTSFQEGVVPVEYLTPTGLVRLREDGTEEAANMWAGPRGFAMAGFPGQNAIETDMPNLNLPQNESPKNPKPGKVRVRCLKRPSLRIKPASANDSGSADVAQPPAADPPPGTIYKIEHYIGRRSFGVR